MIFVVVKQPVRAKYADELPSLVEEFTTVHTSRTGEHLLRLVPERRRPESVGADRGFRDREAGDAHVQSAHFKAAMEQMPRWLAAAPEIINVEVPGDSWSQMS